MNDTTNIIIDFFQRHSQYVSFPADVITILTLIITSWTLLTVRKYKSRVIDNRIINDNLESIKKLSKRIELYLKKPNNPLPDNTLESIKINLRQLKKYSVILQKSKYKKHIEAVLKIEKLNDDVLTQIKNDTETIIGILENDK
jgi:hypothetical protein